MAAPVVRFRIDFAEHSSVGPGKICLLEAIRDSGSLSHARAVIQDWRREYDEERPKKSLGGLTPAQYAKQLAIKVVTIPKDSNALRY